MSSDTVVAVVAGLALGGVVALVAGQLVQARRDRQARRRLEVAVAERSQERFRLEVAAIASAQERNGATVADLERERDAMLERRLAKLAHDKQAARDEAEAFDRPEPDWLVERVAELTERYREAVANVNALYTRRIDAARAREAVSDGGQS